MRNPLLAAFGCWLLTALTSGCLDNRCQQINEEPVRYTDGHTNSTRTFYESSTLGEPLLRFPAARNFHLEHGLREKPVDVSVFVSFDSDAEKRMSLATGNQALLTITDDYIEVLNDTCADFFVRVTAWSRPPESLAGGESFASDASALPTQERDSAATRASAPPDAADTANVDSNE